MNFEVSYHESVVKEDIPKLSGQMKTRIKSAIEVKLMVDPVQFGMPLRRSLKNYRKLRVGDYRIIFCIKGKIVKIFLIQHRSVVYKHAKKRMNPL